MKIRKMQIVVVSALMLALACATVDQILADINLLIQAAASIGVAVGNVSPTDAAEIQTVAGIASSGLAVIQQAYDTYKATNAATDLAKVQAAISAAISQLDNALAAAHISNPNTQAKVKAWVALTTSTLTVILGLLPQLQSAAQGKKTAAKVAAPKPSDIQKQWNLNVCNGDKACSNLLK